MTDHYILCAVTFVLWVPLDDERNHVVKKPEALEKKLDLLIKDMNI